MNRFSRLVIFALPLLPLAADAAPNAAIVPADAKWMVYADLNAIRNSTLGKELMQQIDSRLEMDAPVRPNYDKILGAVGSVTAYGMNFSEQPDQMDGTAYVQGTADLRKITESLLLSQTITTPEHVVELTDLGFPAYGIKAGPGPKTDAAKDKAGADEKKEEKAKKAPRDPNKIEVIIAYPPEGGVLVSRSKAQLTRTRDLLRGSGASLAKSNSALKRFLGQANDAYIFAASEAPPEKSYPADAPPARIIKMAKFGSVVIGEHAAETFAHIELIAADDATAEKLMKILDGLTAMISMTETNDRQLGEFLNAASAGREADRVFVNITYPSARLVQMIHNAQTPDRSPNRGPQGPYVNGTALAKWTGAPYAPPADGAALIETSHTLENVALKNGATITLARVLNGARFARFTRVEIAPAGGGAPLVFKSFVPAGPRASAMNFEFPGADGTYNINVVSSVGDPEGKVEYAVSVKDPRPAPAPKSK